MNHHVAFALGVFEVLSLGAADQNTIDLGTDFCDAGISLFPVVKSIFSVGECVGVVNSERTDEFSSFFGEVSDHTLSEDFLTFAGMDTQGRLPNRIGDGLRGAVVAHETVGILDREGIGNLRREG